MLLAELEKNQNGGVPSDESDFYANRLLCLALDIGEGLLKSGAEVHRVENTVERICRAYGAVHVEVFAITSLILASVRMSDNGYSMQQRRVYDSASHLSRLEDFNSISRKICRDTPPLDEVDAMIKELKHRKPYPTPLLFLGSAMAASAFTLFFGGSWCDAILALLLGLAVAGIARIRSTYVNQIAKLMLTSFTAGCLANLGVFVGVGANVDAVMIGTIMLLIPGLAFGNAIRDLLCGDILAGILKTVQSCLSAVLIAFGFMLAAILMESAGLTRIAVEMAPQTSVMLVASIFGTAGFAMVFCGKLKYIPIVTLCGFFTTLIYLLASALSLPPFLCAFVAAAFATAFSETCARVFRAPTIVFSIPGVIVIVPGSGLYYTMNALLFGEGDWLNIFKNMLLISAGIALGTVLVSILFNAVFGFIQHRKMSRIAK